MMACMAHPLIALLHVRSCSFSHAPNIFLQNVAVRTEQLFSLIQIINLPNEVYDTNTTGRPL